MAWYVPDYLEGREFPVPTLEKLREVKGPLDLKQCQIWFAKFCECNPTFTAKLLMNVSLYPIQDLLIRAFFKKDFSLMIAGRGFSKTYTVAIFVVLYALFRPGVKIVICSGGFRQSKEIFKAIEGFIQKGPFLQQCVTRQPTHSTDMYEMEINGSNIKALPLTEKIRGTRANVVIADELLLISMEIEKSVVRPFLNVRYKPREQDEIKKNEDELVAQGKLKDCDRTQMINNKWIGLSSASFKIDPLYTERFEKYIEIINNPEVEGRESYFVTRLSYEAAPEKLLADKHIEQERQSNSTQQFDKEYRALFISEGGGYFKLENIQKAKVDRGDEPSSRLVGLPDKKYILAIDSNYNDSELSDDFAMSVIELDEQHEIGTLVHAYAMPKSNTQNRAQYLHYLLTSFNIVYIIVDGAGGPRFIEDYKQFLGSKALPISQFEAEFLDGPEGIALAMASYSQPAQRIIHSQNFRKAGWAQLSDERLQTNIEFGRIRFGAPMFSDISLDRFSSAKVPPDLQFKRNGDENLKDYNEYKRELMENIDANIDLTTIQLSFLELNFSQQGVHRLELPKSQKSSRNPNRMRKDLYSTLAMASWAMGCYFILNKTQPQTYVRIRPMRLCR